MTTFRGMEIGDFWPHKFAPHGKEVQIGEEPLASSDDGTHTKAMRPIYAQPMHCVHCQVEFIRGKDPMPSGSCPARSTKKELNRLTGL